MKMNSQLYLSFSSNFLPFTFIYLASLLFYFGVSQPWPWRANLTTRLHLSVWWTFHPFECTFFFNLIFFLYSLLSVCLQKTHQSALQVQQKAETLLQANHYDMDMIRDCAENVASHWQQLMLKMEDRLKLVNASVAFYKTSEQVWN